MKSGKRVFFTPSINIEDFVITFFDLNEVETTSLISKMSRHFHLINKQQEPIALVA